MANKKQPSNNLEELRKHWYAKLKKKGFEDIEANDYDLKNPSYRYAHLDRRAQYTMEQAKIHWAAKQEYYYLATHFLNSYKFETVRERNIWEYHSNGVSVRSIVQILNKLPGKKTNRDYVNKLIMKLAGIMKKQCLKGD